MVILLVVLFVEITDVLLVAFFTSSMTVLLLPLPPLVPPEPVPPLLPLPEVLSPMLVTLSEVPPPFSSGINSSLV